MDIYKRKQRWKIVLFGVATAIVGVSLWYTDMLVKNIAADERKKVQFWADAIKRKANLVKYTESFFEQMKTEERKKVKLWAEATKRLIVANINEDLTFYSEIISDNTNIPVILVNDKEEITAVKNVELDIEKYKTFDDSLKKEFGNYQPIVVKYGRNKNYLYYKDSKLFSKIKEVLDDIIKSFFSEIVVNNASVPVIITDSSGTNIIASGGGINIEKIKDGISVKQLAVEMQSENPPIEIEFSGYGKNYIYYKNSYLLRQLKYYPYLQLGVIGIFLLITYLVFSTARRSEQNMVWVGMSKETAHQLGTPLSSMMAWVEVLKLKGIDNSITSEIEKDIYRLETITQRFSSIGSIPKLKEENIVNVIYQSLDYMKLRTSPKINFVLNIPRNYEIMVPLNVSLFEWVIENLVKNSVDAMDNAGEIKINLINDQKSLIIDFADSGKGLHKSKFKTIFNPGYTNKNRGWGLGLTLAKRIINEYHSGNIFVKSSTIGKGTTFRIVLNKDMKVKK